MEHVKNGCLSDPDTSLFTLIKEGSYGLYQKFKVGRGTSILETFHSHVTRIIRTRNSSPKFLHCVLMNFVFRWNVDRAVEGKLHDDYGAYNYHELETFVKTYQANFHVFEAPDETRLINDPWRKPFPPKAEVDTSTVEKFGADYLSEVLRAELLDENDEDDVEFDVEAEDDLEDTVNEDENDLPTVVAAIFTENQTGLLDDPEIESLHVSHNTSDLLAKDVILQISF